VIHDVAQQVAQANEGQADFSLIRYAAQNANLARSRFRERCPPKRRLADAHLSFN
jgi:hypothetical protein